GPDRAAAAPPDSKAAVLYQRLEAMLRTKLEAVDWMCGLSETQRQRLTLAARGDIERVLSAVPQGSEDDAGVLPAIRLSRIMFDDDSLFERILRRTLTAEQSKHFAAL